MAQKDWTEVLGITGDRAHGIVGDRMRSIETFYPNFHTSYARIEAN